MSLSDVCSLFSAHGVSIFIIMYGHLEDEIC
jgi:hypothetical protein